MGHALETVVLNELERRGADVGHVKTDEGLEVDFLARWADGGQELIQVCADVSQEEILAREIRSLKAAAKEHRRARPLLLVLDRDEGSRVLDAPVEVRPAYEWLLAPGPAR